MLVGYEGWSSRLFNFVKVLLAFSGWGRAKRLVLVWGFWVDTGAGRLYEGAGGRCEGAEGFMKVPQSS